MLILKNTGPKITIQDIEYMEQSLNTKFPHTYSIFLLENNGGRPENIQKIIYDKEKSLSTDMQFIFGINKEFAVNDITWNAKVFFSDDPNEFAIPIGCDSGGNIFFLMTTAGQDRGVIYLDRTGEKFELFEISDSFQDFLSILN